MLLSGLYITLVIFIYVIAIDHYLNTRKINEAQREYLSMVLKRRHGAYQAVCNFINSFQLQVLASQTKSSMISRPTLTNIHETLQTALINSVWLSNELLRNLNDFNVLILTGKANFITENWKYHSFTDLDIHSATSRMGEIQLQYTKDVEKLNDVESFLDSKNQTSVETQQYHRFKEHLVMS